MKIAVHTLVKNEARFVWFSVMSVIEYVDRVLLWDTGSTDGTVEILKAIKKRYPKKVELELRGEVSAEEFCKVRGEMLQRTEEDWFLVVDGDEIWWDESISKAIKLLKEKGGKLESVVVPTINLVGDIYHYQEEAAGHYRLAGRVGHLNLRAVNRGIAGLASDKPHGTWGWVDGEGRMIQDRDQKKIAYVEAPYLHASFLRRAGTRAADAEVPKRQRKLKHEIGIEFPRDYFYPEVFFRERPKFVEGPWERMDLPFYLRSLVETPLRKFKRRVLPVREGY